jgi:O-methyltransferase
MMTRIAGRYSIQAQMQRAMLTLSGRELARDQAMKFASLWGVEGDFLELGAFRGDGLVHAYHSNRAWAEFIRIAPPTIPFITPEMRGRPELQRIVRAIEAMRFVAFDSFAGLPEPTEEHEQFFGRGDYACSREVFEENLRGNDVDMSRVVVVPGWFEDTLTAETKQRHGLRAAAVVYVDCDLYEPSRLALEFVTDLLVDGSIIIFDDWYLFRGHPDRGQRRAFREWSEAHPELRFTEFVRNDVNSFIVHR